MEIANCLLALGGDKGNTVPKYAATVAEVAVLRFIHGDDAVFDIDIKGTVSRTSRQEIARLVEQYGRQDGERRVSPAVSALYPGAAAQVHQSFDELELDDSFFIATGRQTARTVDAAPVADEAEVLQNLVTPPVAEPSDLSSLTVNDLRALADREGVDLSGITLKADIIEAIELHRNPGDPTHDIDGNPIDNTGPMDDGMFK